MNNNEQANIAYSNKIHRMGRITTLMLLMLIVATPVLLGVFYSVKVDFSATLTAFITCFMLFGTAGAVEFISYAPILGAGGQYLSFITGNIMNMKLPAAISSIKLSKYQEGTPEADIVSTIAIGISSLVTMAVLIIGLILGSFLLPFLQSPILAPAFNNLMPAILGALSLPQFVQNPKGASGPIVIAAILYFTMGRTWYTSNNTYLIPLFLVISIAWSYLLYRIDQKKK